MHHSLELSEFTFEYLIVVMSMCLAGLVTVQPHIGLVYSVAFSLCCCITLFRVGPRGTAVCLYHASNGIRNFGLFDVFRYDVYNTDSNGTTSQIVNQYFEVNIKKLACVYAFIYLYISLSIYLSS